MASPVVSSRLGRVEEPNGVQSCPNRAKTEVLSVTLWSSRAQARRSDSMLERTAEMLRLLAREKLPSKSASTRAVSAVLEEMSGHSKLVPKREPRDFRWNS